MTDTTRQHIPPGIEGVVLSFALGSAAVAMVLCGCMDLMQAAVVAVVAFAVMAIRKARFAVVCLLSFCVGASLFYLCHTRQSRGATNGNAVCEGIVTGDAVGKGKVKWTDVCVTRRNGNDVKPFRLRLGIVGMQTDELPRAGAHIRWCAELKQVSDTSSYGRYLMSQGTYRIAFVNGRNLSVRPDGDDGMSLRLPLSDRMRLMSIGWRNKALRTLERQGIGSDELSVLSALTLGEKTKVDKSVRSVYSDAGASHILALSGMHLGIIFLLLMALTGGDMGPIPLRIVGRTTAVVAILMYVWMVGMPVSAVRSAVMLTVCAVGFLAQNDSSSRTSLSLAALLIILHNPFSVFDIGFQLSFASVFSITHYYGKLYRRVPRVMKHTTVVRWATQTVCLSCVAQLGVAPLVMFHFGSFPVYFLLANFVALPLATVLLYGAVLAWAVWFLPSVQHVLMVFLGSVVSLMNQLLSVVASLPGATIKVGDMTVQQVVFIYLVVFLAFRSAHLLNPKTKLKVIEDGMEEPFQ